MNPILFNTEMVKAILEDKKTVTRRIIKKRYSNTHLEMFTNKYGTRLIEIQNNVEGETYGKNEDGTGWQKLLGMREIEYDHKPYKIGDILYVRETWQCLNPYSDKEYVYKASCNADFASDIGKWLPSIHMPKEAARIFLKVKDVRVEKLRNITKEQSLKEGIRGYTKDGELYKYAVSDDWWLEYHKKHIKEFKGTFWQDMPKCPITAFSYLWDSTINKSNINCYGWDANPWVWIIEFERVEKQNI